MVDEIVARLRRRTVCGAALLDDVPALPVSRRLMRAADVDWQFTTLQVWSVP